MLHFESDYVNGAHPRILQHFIETNDIMVSGYGEDLFCRSAAEKIKAACQCETAQVHLLTGGTQTNQLVIASMLSPWQGVVAAQTGHIHVHEAGAVEQTGHKVLALPQHEGKMDAAELKNLLKTFYADDDREHMVYPGIVYISHPTEYGTLYTKQELTALHEVCGEYQIPLFLDGARLGYGLMSPGTDVTLPDIAALCDVFYIGGTKVGALCGEAVVFTKNNKPPHFVNFIKQHGALLAKGRLLGVQFDALFTDDLYFSISRHAIEMAMQLKKALTEKGYTFFLDSPTNQQFVMLPNEALVRLQEKVVVSVWEKPDDAHTVVRFATSWSTTQEQLDELIDLL